CWPSGWHWSAAALLSLLAAASSSLAKVGSPRSRQVETDRESTGSRGARSKSTDSLARGNLSRTQETRGQSCPRSLLGAFFPFVELLCIGTGNPIPVTFLHEHEVRSRRFRRFRLRASCRRWHAYGARPGPELVRPLPE